MQKRKVDIPARVTRKKGVVRPDNQGPVRAEAQQVKSLAAPSNYAQPNRASSASSHLTPSRPIPLSSAERIQSNLSAQ